jgi:hypothetical protein
VPVLLKRFPNATPEELLKAHAYAYGGAIILDMGYYPFGNAFFSDLTHYVSTAGKEVRTGGDVRGQALRAHSFLTCSRN